MDATTKQTTLEARLETRVRGAVSWVEECILSLIRLFIFILNIPRRVLPTLLHVAAFTTVLPPLFAVSIGAGITVVNLIPAGWEAELWMQYGEQATPFARTTLPLLMPDQPYEISLDLDVPVSPNNLALGNFMTKLIITDPRNMTVASANRPALVLGQESSSWIPFVYKLAQIETVRIPLIERWSPVLPSGVLTNSGVAIARGTTQKGFNAFVAVGRADAWKGLGSGQGREISIVRAVLRGKVHLSGFRGYFARHTLLLFALTSVAFFITATGAALILYVVFAPNLSDAEDTTDGNTAMAIGQGQQTTPRLRVKSEESERSSASETEYSWTSGPPDARIKLESEDDDSSSSI